MAIVRPYGTWHSPLSARDLATGIVGLSDLLVDDDALLWTELRPTEDGRKAVVRHDGTTGREVTSGGRNIRTRVHEYGGAPFAVRDGLVVGSEFADQRLYRLDGDGGPVTGPPSSPGSVRYADGRITADGRWLVCVRESHDRGAEPANEIVAVSLADGSERVLVGGRDFVASPRITADGRRLAWLAWDHPAMPWDAAEAWVADLDPGEVPRATNARRVAGGRGVSVAEIAWHPDRGLLVSHDEAGFWQLHAVADGAPQRLSRLDHDGAPTDLGQPHWEFGASTMAVLPDGRIAVAPVQEARSLLGILDPATGEVTWSDAEWTRISHLRAWRGGVAFLGGSPQTLRAVVHRRPDGTEERLREVGLPQLRDGDRPEPEAITFPTADDEQAHGFLYRPRNADTHGPADENPPLVVLIHGGPTANAYPTLSPEIVFWTTRGVAVVDVNYRGSTGYGRAYRDALRGRWGVNDVQDCLAAAGFLAGRGDVDMDRMAIRGGSAGGYTTLMALTAEEQVFAAGASHYGVADLAALTEHTHKFESRYLDGLVGPYPEAAELYHERSPLSRIARLRTPVIVLQGDEDEVVPPAQSRRIAAAAAERGVQHAYLEFEGEQHGFRRADTLETALTAELVFYGQVMGFTPAGDLPDLDDLGAIRE